MARDEDRYDERDRGGRQDRGTQQRGREWSDADDYYGNRSTRDDDEGRHQGVRGTSRTEGGRYGGDWTPSMRSGQHGAYDEGTYQEREYGDGMYNTRPGQQGQESYGGGTMSGASGWGRGRGQNRYGDTGSDNYAGHGGGYYGQGSGEFDQSRSGGYGGQWNAAYTGGRQWGGNESMAHGGWGSGQQQGGGYRGPQYNAYNAPAQPNYGTQQYGAPPHGPSQYGASQYGASQYGTPPRPAQHQGGYGQRPQQLADMPAREYYSERTGAYGGGGLYGGGSQYYQGGGFGDSGTLYSGSQFADVRGATGAPGYGGYAGTGMGGAGYGGSAAYGGTVERGPGRTQSGMSARPNHAGRGPKNWKRSDERITEDLSEQLERHSHLDASDIEVHVDDGDVKLTGTVPDRQSKRLAEDIAESVWGVRDVQNQIRVNRDDSKGGFFDSLFGDARDDDEDEDHRRDAGTKREAKRATTGTTGTDGDTRGRKSTTTTAGTTT